MKEQQMKDSYNILTPIDDKIANDAIGYEHSVKWCNYMMSSKLNLRHAVNGYTYVKWLKAFKDSVPMSRKQAQEKTSIYMGTDNWKRINEWMMLDLDHVGKYRCAFYKLSHDGERALAMVEANDAFYRVMRWFDHTLDEDQLTVELMQADLNGEEAWKSLEPEGFIKMYDAVFNPESLCRKVGSSYRWINKICHMCKVRQDFFEKTTCDEVIAWFNSHIHYDGVSNFLKFLEKLQKKYAKAAQRS